MTRTRTSTLTAGTLVELAPDRPVAGGRMLARLDGQVVLVSGAIPGERGRARVERVTRHVAWAQTVDVLEASADRREPICDLACGGSLYAHITYARQLALKADVVADAFRRIGKMPLNPPPTVMASDEHGYRVRARLHVNDDRLGFYREGSHRLCDAAATRQLRDGAIDAASAVLASLGEKRAACAAVVVAENVAATERVCHLEPRD